MESVSRISSILDPARDLTFEAVQAAGISKKLGAGPSSSSRNLPFAKIKALLDSRSDREIIDGLRRVISMVYQHKPCLPYFSSVVKNVANANVEVKKLVYIYLLHYAESDPDLALLSVNAIQKSLSDQNPQIRAMALRTMAGMRVPIISQIVLLAIKRGVGDMSPQVRKAAALAIPKCYRLDPTSLPQLLEFISALLADKQYFVVGPAVQAFLEICPERIDLVHKHYRNLVRKLVDMDEWGQLATLRLLLFYSRRCFPRKVQNVTKINKKGFYDDEQDEIVETGEVARILDPDLELLLKACRSLLFSRNPAIIIAVASCFLYLGTEDWIKEAIGPLVALTRGTPESSEATFCNIVLIALTHAKLFVPYASHFIVTANDSTQTWRLKIEMLTLIFPHAASHLKSIILSELQHFCHSADINQIQESVRAIGRCAQSDPTTSSRCFKVLLNQIDSFDNTLVSEVLTVMRHLIQQDPQSHKKTVVRLARNLDTTTSPAARATIIWLVGEFSGTDPDQSIAADVLRILVNDFANESEEAKQQIVLLAAKVYLYYIQSQDASQDVQSDIQASMQATESPTDAEQGREHQQLPAKIIDPTHPIPQIWEYVLVLARYDTSYDLRDRARLLKSLLANPSSTQLAALLVLAPKPVPYSPSPSLSRSGLTLGSTTLVLGKDVAGISGLAGYEEIPDWVSPGSEPDPRLRDPDGEVGGEEYVSAAKREASTAAARRLDDAVRDQGLEKVVARGSLAPKAKTGGKSVNGQKGLDAWLDESDEESAEDSEEETDDDSEEYESDEEEESDEESDEADMDNSARRGLIS